MDNILKKREIVSFDGPCPYNCKHCYTFGLKEENKHLTIENIINSLKGKEFDVIYVSHNKENFLKPSEGIKLCEELFSNYNKDIIAITPAMISGSKLNNIFNKFKDRAIDLGINEEHAVVMAASMSRFDLIPIISIYSTFLQRAYDQICHDVCRSNNHVIFLLDHAGIVSGDGSTHQGVFDIPMLISMPNIVISTPSNILLIGIFEYVDGIYLNSYLHNNDYSYDEIGKFQGAQVYTIRKHLRHLFCVGCIKAG